MTQNNVKLPATGSFPFFERSRNAFATWGKALEAQANIFNDQWIKIKAGSYGVSDWFSAMARSTDLGASTMEELWTQMTSDAAPPWKSLKWNAKGEVEVKLRETLSADDNVTVTGLTRLGGGGANPPKVQVSKRYDDPKAVAIWLDAQPNVDDGEYVGLVMRSSSARPLAVITVSKP